ncbi:NAD(P)-dependent oxidoreductase [Limimaricola variabilis]|nr:NAD(P)-dependent oxidoreductase [Limimaricola variabilis]
MWPVFSFPALECMEYPQIDSAGLRCEVSDVDAIIRKSQGCRAAVRVLMTSASRGCDATLLRLLPSLGLVVSHGAGRDRIDSAALAARGIRLRCIAEAATEDVADHAMALTLMLFRNLPRAQDFVRSGGWGKGRFELSDSLSGACMGIAGLSGRIGQALAQRARAAGMTLAGLDRASNQDLGVPLFPDWKALARASDVLVLAVPGTPDLEGIVDAPVLDALGPRGRLVNVGRGTLVDTKTLIKALHEGRIAGAALDVLDTEPYVPAPLAAAPNLILTPHMAAQTRGHRGRAARIAEREILDFLAG